MDKNIVEGHVPSGVEMIHTPSIKFRSLLPSEVDVRPAESKNLKATLLLYQDARCAQNILDESVGQFNWQKEYYESVGLLFCKIGIKDQTSGEWIWKADTGSKSNIEEDKGLASDAFKRAAVSWGIGRELYSAPRITINLTEKDMFNGKLSQKFSVSDMAVVDGTITKLSIVDKWGKERFSYTFGQEPVYETSDSVVNEDIDIPDFTEIKPQPALTTLSPNDIIKQFCLTKSKENGIDRYQLDRFYKFYLSPSNKDPKKSIAESFDNLNPNTLWSRWMERAKMC